MKFSTLPLKKEMLINLDKISYLQMTPVQAQTLPLILDGKDVIAQAKTGSGKTAAFGIGVLNKLDVKKFRIQTLILCPTRELADQVAKELRMIAKFAHNIKILTLCGGAAFGPQLGSLRHGAHIVVGTPGRVLKHLNKNTLTLENLDSLVFDEADRMLDMGFIEEIDKILEFTPKTLQTLLFSATFTDEITSISKRIQDNAIYIKTVLSEQKNNIQERFYESNNKVDTLVRVLNTFKPENIIVFTNTKLTAKVLAENLVNSNIDALAIHGDLEQYERNDVLVQFSNKSCPVLIATDVAARGLDIKELAMVVNFDIPHTMETYTHRIGRTGRASKDGIAISIYTNDEIDEVDDYKDNSRIFESADVLKKVNNFEMKPQNITLVIEGGKKDKLRAGDILGALTGDAGLKGSSIGKIDIYDRQAYVAIQREFIDEAHKKLLNCKIKNKKFSVWVL
jgi:ATP-independent RNA helicase DbpA